MQGFYRNLSEVEHALHEKAVGLHTKIKYRYEGVDLASHGRCWTKSIAAKTAATLLTNCICPSSFE